MALALQFKVPYFGKQAGDGYYMWKEILKVRTKGPDAAQAGHDLGEYLKLSRLPAGLRRHQVFRNSTHPNEVMLMLDWDSPSPELGGSELARRLAYTMKRHGLVDLSAWHDEPRSTESGPTRDTG